MFALSKLLRKRVLDNLVHATHFFSFHAENEKMALLPCRNSRHHIFFGASFSFIKNFLSRNLKFNSLKWFLHGDSAATGVKREVYIAIFCHLHTSLLRIVSDSNLRIKLEPSLQIKIFLYKQGRDIIKRATCYGTRLKWSYRYGASR